MYHSITFNTFNTWEDWRLIPSSPPQIPPPPIRKNFVELPGGNGSVNLTSFLSKTPLYGMREGTWEFAITDQSITREQTVSTIVSALHGKWIDKIILEDDPNYYYSGLVEVSMPKVGKSYSTITIGFTINPFKHKLSEWDSDTKEDIV